MSKCRRWMMDDKGLARSHLQHRRPLDYLQAAVASDGYYAELSGLSKYLFIATVHVASQLPALEAVVKDAVGRRRRCLCVPMNSLPIALAVLLTLLSQRIAFARYGWPTLLRVSLKPDPEKRVQDTRERGGRQQPSSRCPRAKVQDSRVRGGQSASDT